MHKSKYNNCKYCGRLVLGRPFCNRCSSKFFNYNSNYYYRYANNNSNNVVLLKDGFPNLKETASDRGKRFYEKYYANRRYK